jgi:hypothetical protein
VYSDCAINYFLCFKLTVFTAFAAAVFETVPDFAGDFTVLVCCERALPAAVLDVALVRPSDKTFEAAVAALVDVVFAGAFVCESALPAAVLDFVAVEELFNVFAALVAAFFPVTLDFVILFSPVLWQFIYIYPAISLFPAR